MLMKQTLGERLFEICNITFMVILCVVSLYPLLFVLFASLSDPVLVTQHRGLLLFPQGFNVEAYKRVFENPLFATGYLNTIFYVFVGTAINMLLTAFGAYALSRRDVMWATPVMFMIVFTMFFQGGLIPLYILIQNLGIMDTRLALILPVAVSAFNLIILRTSFQNIPVDLDEAASIDGASEMTKLFRIVLPLSMPVLSVLLLFYGVYHWNAWFHAIMFLQNRDLFPMQLILRDILIANDTSSMLQNVSQGDQIPVGETIKYATIIVATLPILFVYPFLQRHFVKGVMIGGIKG
jgi:putative aldouronate transport system permease protein